MIIGKKVISFFSYSRRNIIIILLFCCFCSIDWLLNIISAVLLVTYMHVHVLCVFEDGLCCRTYTRSELFHIVMHYVYTCM